MLQEKGHREDLDFDHHTPPFKKSSLSHPQNPERKIKIGVHLPIATAPENVATAPENVATTPENVTTESESC
ncbi:unnamed protein product [Trifolium pratense]|uniref:Uncharacterized protein n=1 Tax=Trifolium pratense TaxID=57577 RepID=A0ACB0LWL3_TRIPR|nr:unnamed protein product [Trifolium pratense]